MQRWRIILFGIGIVIGAAAAASRRRRIRRRKPPPPPPHPPPPQAAAIVLRLVGAILLPRLNGRPSLVSSARRMFLGSICAYSCMQ